MDILMSLRPEWCEKMISGEKTIEVRKTTPRVSAPFKVYLYCTMGNTLCPPHINSSKWDIHTVNGKEMSKEDRERSDFRDMFVNGKIIGEWICDKTIKHCINDFSGEYEVGDELKNTGLTQEDLLKYGKGKPLYFWHVSDLQIYNKPKELRDFAPYTGPFVMNQYGTGADFKRLSRPPQSWCYVLLPDAV